MTVGTSQVNQWQTVWYTDYTVATGNVWATITVHGHWLCDIDMAWAFIGVVVDGAPVNTAASYNTFSKPPFFGQEVFYPLGSGYPLSNYKMGTGWHHFSHTATVKLPKGPHRLGLGFLAQTGRHSFNGAALTAVVFKP